MRVLEAMLKEMLPASAARDAVLILTHTLEEQRDELLDEIHRNEDMVRRSARLETAIIGIYAILHLELEPAQQLQKITRIIEEVILYKPAGSDQKSSV